MEDANEIIDEIITKIKNLEQKNDILKAFIKTHHPEIAKINNITLDVVVKATDEQLREENKQLKEQLAEKDKEIEELKEYRKGAYEKYVSKCAYLQQQIKDTCKHVCDKIRRKMTVYRYVEVKTKNGYEWALTDSDINEILDQIEQAKESIDEKRN